MNIKFVSACFFSIYLISPSLFAADNWADYNNRYKLTDPDMKLVNNRGDGFDLLYGTRNFRAVLPGMQYRGGANNLYHKDSKRDNQNPLPNDGLMNLCEEGFSSAVYLYATNYSTAPSEVSCVNRLNNLPNKLSYLQVSPFGDQGLKKIMTLVRESILSESIGPIYTHCWNGWHASGLVSAVALRQFCNWSVDQAVAYWDRNTDGVNKDPYYEKSRDRIRTYQIADDLSIDKKLTAKICPQ